jgi:hypothetical protein
MISNPNWYTDNTWQPWPTITPTTIPPTPTPPGINPCPWPPVHIPATNVQEGWRCPQCKWVYAPTVKECKRCNEALEE